MVVPFRLAPFFCILTGLTSLCMAQSTSNGIAAVVNGNVITKSEVREAVNAQEQMLRFQHQNDPTVLQRELANLRATALDSLIDRELVLAEFKRLGAQIKAQWVDDDINSIIRESFKGDRDAFVRELAGNGMTLKKFRDMREKMMIVQAMRGKVAANNVPATPKEVEEYYQKNISRWREGGMIKISTITLPKFTADSTPEKQRKLAEELRRKVASGADFASLARTYSQDSHAENGGSWDWMQRDQMKPSIAAIAFELKTGGVSNVLEEEGAYIIIVCDAVKHGKAKPLSEVRNEVERLISADKSKVVLDQWMDGLRKRAVIKKFGW
ncbi:MAG: SurA N-terminal domain-containing protein [Prosthecobacter sp.]|nr:SurA N-terminal domain-containing protein [Prosthecobacter sp.]